MTIIPQTLAQIAKFLENHLKFATLLSEFIYDRLLSRDQTHPLVQLKELLDFTPMEIACADYHQKSGSGCKPTHTVPKLLRALLVKYFYNDSLRDAEFHIRYNMLIKWFVGYAIFDEGLDHSTLCRFELYLILNHPRLFFDTILKQIDAMFPHDRNRPQIGDTFAVHANAALESLNKRLRHSCQKLLVAFQKADPVAYDELWRQLNREAIFGAADEKIEYYLASGQRQQRLLNTLNGICDCLNLIQEYSLPPSVEKWVHCLQKIMADELRLERNKENKIMKATFLPKNKRGKYALFSATDPDATIRNHGPDKKDSGYNASVTATVDFIREIRADTGSQPDPVAIPDLLEAQIEHHGLCPEKFIYDQAAGTGKAAADVQKATDGRTQLVVKPKLANKKETDKHQPTHFILSEDKLTLTCPNGRSTTHRYRSGSGDGFNFRFLKGQCAGCLLLAACRGKDKWPHPPSPYDLPTTHRNVFISDYRMEWEELVTYSKTDEFKDDMKLRPQIERVIAGLVLHNGARRSRFRGLEKVDYQLKLCAMAYNLKRWLALLSGKRHKKRCRFGAPPPSRGEVGLMTA